MPGEARLAAEDARRLIDERFQPPLALRDTTFRYLPHRFTEIDMVGGAVYDALIALAALDHDAVLATRDERARNTYDKLGVRVEAVA
ncbi:MAG: hypothetical protein WA991_17420 [Ornithinimicrobium sp.]